MNLKPIAVLAGCTLLFWPLAPAWAESADSDYLALDLEELMQVVVTSVTKNRQTLAETAAAAFVISAEDIRRSGASTIPEALRLAPGVQVAAIGNNKWAVSIRGQADRFSNKLLVLVDGLSVYSPVFTGVVWEAVDVPLENIERIEVIRGPGAATWGANAVHGVINIISKSAFDTRGGQVAVAAGSELRGEGFARYGWNLNPNTAAQVYAKARNTDESRLVTGGNGADSWQTRTAGFKLEHLKDHQATFKIQGGVIDSKAGDEVMMVTDLGNTPVRATQQLLTSHLLGSWENQTSATRQDSFQASLHRSDYDHVILNELRTTADLEYRQRRIDLTGHDITFGLGYRYSQDKTTGSSIVAVPDPKQSFSLYSAFLQDEIQLHERWRLSLGARLDRYSHDHRFEFQPNARLLWMPEAKTSVWLSASRAVRSSSRIERGGTILLPMAVALPMTTGGAWQMENSSSQSEKMNALDLGMRHQFSSAFSLDLAGFYYRYDHLRDAVLAGTPIVTPAGYVYIPTANTSANKGTARGVEAAVNWKPRADWQLQAAYSYLDSKIELASGRLPSGYEGTTPTHLLSLRSSVNLSPTLQFDAWLRYAGKVKAYAIPGYTTLDLRLAWRPRKELELSLIGQNLLDKSHPEYGSSLILSTPTEVQRGVYAKASWKF